MVDEDNAPQVYLLGKTSLVASSRNQFYIRNDPVLQIACGDQHTIIVTQSGRAFAFGDNSSGQLGLGHNDKVDKVSCIKSLKFNDDREKVCLAACGREHSIVTTTKGSLYSFGSNSIDQLGIDTNKYKGESTESKSSLYSKPTKLDSLPANIMWKRLAAGAEHSCALTKQGTVYVWGSNSDGQCGFPKQQETIKLPKELKLQYRVKEIACGYYHTALASDDGSLYTFGNNSDQQLGRSSSEKQTGPIHVPLPNPVKSVACGNQHTAVLTDNGHILVVGNGERGQLGLGRSLSSTERFEPVNEFKGKKVIAIDCGESHTAAIVGKGDLYTFGDGSHGKLGVKDGKVESEFLPRLVDKFRHLTVLNVSCGGCHTILLAQEKSTSNKNASDSDDDIKDTTLSETHVKSLSNNLSKTITSSQSHRYPPRHNPTMRTEPTSDDENESNEEFSSSMKSATFNQTRTLTNGKLKPKESLTHNRPLDTRDEFTRTGTLDRTTKLQKLTTADNDATSDRDLRKTTLQSLSTQARNNSSRLVPFDQNNNRSLLTEHDRRDLRLNAKSYDDDDDDENKLRSQTYAKKNRFDEPPIKNSHTAYDTFDNEQKPQSDRSRRLAPLRIVNNERDSSPKRTHSSDITVRRTPIKNMEEDSENSENENYTSRNNNRESLRNSNAPKLSAHISSTTKNNKGSPDMRSNRKSSIKQSDDSDDKPLSSSKKTSTSAINQQLRPNTRVNSTTQNSPLVRKANTTRQTQQLASNDEDDGSSDGDYRETNRNQIHNHQTVRRGSLPNDSRSAPYTGSLHRDENQTISSRPPASNPSRTSFKRTGQTSSNETLVTSSTKTNSKTSEPTSQQAGFFSRLFHRTGSTTSTKPSTPTSSMQTSTTQKAVKSDTTITQSHSNTTSKTCVVM